MHWHVPEVNRNVFARFEICNFPGDKQDGALTFSLALQHTFVLQTFFYFLPFTINVRYASQNE